MMQAWKKFALKIDALSLRERAIIFAMAALALISLVNTSLLDPQFAQQKQLTQRIKQEQVQIVAIQAEIQQKVKSREVDPDAANLVRLQVLKQQSAQLQDSLRDMQSGLVSPDKMARLLEDIVKQNSQLRVMALKTLPVSRLSEVVSIPNTVAEKAVEATAVPASVLTKDRTENKSAADLVYRHGVEITVQGAYLDMMRYMTALETMPWQLFWGGAKLDAGEYPKATLTLTLYTLSLDKKWLNL
jgi:MSHA biogenesis protein MshJ